MLKLRLAKRKGRNGDLAVLAMLIRETQARYDEPIAALQPLVRDIPDPFPEARPHRESHRAQPRNRRSPQKGHLG